jgi:hypothetical protein
MIIRDYAYKFWRYLAVVLAVAIFFRRELVYRDDVAAA